MRDYSFVVRDHNPFYIQALVLAKVVEKILIQKAGLRLSSRPLIKTRPIVSFMDRIRVSGLEKFDQKTLVSVVNFYRDRAEETSGKAVGAVILYVSEDYAYRLIRQLDYPIDGSNDDEGVIDGCGAFCNLIAGNFKNGLTKIGYQDLVMSHFLTYENSAVDGVPYDGQQKELYEVIFEIGGIRRIVVDLTMGVIRNESDI